ncbi:ABCAA protein, partial [Crypturellus soui]|nr:ABCAA protein [Crypturellus soui]
GLFFPSRLLLFGIFILPLFVNFLMLQLTEGFNSLELAANLYFVPTEKNAHIKPTNLLIFNDTGSHIEDFIRALRSQKIVPEIAVEENITSLPRYNGAIKVSREGQV